MSLVEFPGSTERTLPGEMREARAPARSREVRIASVPTLTPAEHAATARLIGRVRGAGVPVRAAFLFGSKARGDFDVESDVDILLLADVPEELRDAAARYVGEIAREVQAETGTAVETWVVPLTDLESGRRTPMLVDAIEDGLPLWPAGLRPLHLPFTPADARFCAGCLLDWVRAGGTVVEEALAAGDAGLAAQRARDDITRMATAALLLTGDTRHRRRSSLARFEERFVATRRVSPRVLPALRWAHEAFPADEGRGREEPEPSAFAVETAVLGRELAAVMQEEVVPLILERLDGGSAGS